MNFEWCSAEALMSRPSNGEDDGSAVVIEGLNSNIAVLLQDGSLALRPDGCYWYLGQTARGLLQQLEHSRNAHRRVGSPALPPIAQGRREITRPAHLRQVHAVWS